jgi:hypothetical protein
MRLAILRFHHRAVIDDHGESAGDLLRDGQRKIEAPPGYQGDLDALGRGGLNGEPVGFWHLRSAIEQGSIDIERDQADLMLAVRECHFVILHAGSGDSLFRGELELRKERGAPIAGVLDTSARRGYRPAKFQVSTGNLEVSHGSSRCSRLFSTSKLL